MSEYRSFFKGRKEDRKWSFPVKSFSFSSYSILIFRKRGKENVTTPSKRSIIDHMNRMSSQEVPPMLDVIFLDISRNSLAVRLTIRWKVQKTIIELCLVWFKSCPSLWQGISVLCLLGQLLGQILHFLLPRHYDFSHTSLKESSDLPLFSLSILEHFVIPSYPSWTGNQENIGCEHNRVSLYTCL